MHVNTLIPGKENAPAQRNASRPVMYKEELQRAF
jgi:hypothetical protein